MTIDPDERASLPSLSALITLIGGRELIVSLRDANLERRIFVGFRSDPKSLTSPIIRKRIQELLHTTDALNALSSRFEHLRGDLFTALEQLPDPPADEGIRELAAQHGAEVVQWALILHPRTGLNAASAPADCLEEPEPSDGPDASISGVAEHVVSPVPTIAFGISDSEKRQTAPRESEHAGKPRESEHAGKPRAAASIQPREPPSRADPLAERKDLESARRELNEARRLQHSAEEDLKSARRKLERLQKKLDEETARADRAAKALRREKVKTVSSLTDRAPAANWGAAPPSVATSVDLSRQVLQRLIEKRLFDAAAAYAREWLDLDPVNPVPRKLMLEALTLGGSAEEVGQYHYHAGATALAENRRQEAVAEFCESIRAAPGDADVTWRMEKLLEITDAGSRAEVEQVAQLYGELLRTSLDAAKTFESLARRLKRGLWRRLQPALVVEHKRVEAPWPGAPGGSLSASQLAAAIAAADESLVDPFRKWAAGQSGEVRQAALHVIEGANAYLPGARRVLSASTRPVVVDGSNVAWDGNNQESGPNLENIRAVRQKLLEAGFFPIIILCDASLLFQVKNPDRLNRWELRGEIRFAQSRTDADLSLLTEARRLECPIVTNDLLRDHDPQRRYSRIAYFIGPGGVTLDEKP